MNYFTAPVTCPRSMVYKECGTNCGQICGEGNVGSDCDDTQCVDGCFCPVGHFFDGYECVEPEHCSCKRDDSDYPIGSVYKTGCDQW